MKIAILLSGRIHTTHAQYQNTMDNLVQSHDCDFFISHGTTDSQAMIDLFVSLYRPVRIVQIDEEYMDTSVYPTLNIRHNMMCMFLNRQTVYESFDEYVTSTGTVYDIIVSSRVDLWFSNAIDYDHVRDPNILYIPLGADHDGLNDQFAVSKNPQYMKAYLTIYSDMMQILKTGTKFDPEILVISQVLLHSIQVERFYLAYKINRFIPQKMLFEVGEFDGSDSLRFYENGYRVFTFEPKKDLFDNLTYRTQHLDNYQVFPQAVCGVDGTTTFNICKEGGASSILSFRPDDVLNDTWSTGRTDIHYSGESYEVETIRLDTFIERMNLQNDTIDYIHIDAQGVDLECLMSIGKYITNVVEGVIETVMNLDKSIYIGQDANVYDNVQQFLQEHGFDIINIESNDITGCEYNVHFKKSKK